MWTAPQAGNYLLYLKKSISGTDYLVRKLPVMNKFFVRIAVNAFPCQYRAETYFYLLLQHPFFCVAGRQMPQSSRVLSY